MLGFILGCVHHRLLEEMLLFFSGGTKALRGKALTQNHPAAGWCRDPTAAFGSRGLILPESFVYPPVPSCGQRVAQVLELVRPVQSP